MDADRPDELEEGPSPEDLTHFSMEGLLEHWIEGRRDVQAAPTGRQRALAAQHFWFDLLMAQDHDIAAYGAVQETAWRDVLTLFVAGLLLGLTAEEMRERFRREPPLIA